MGITSKQISILYAVFRIGTNRTHQIMAKSAMKKLVDAGWLTDAHDLTSEGFTKLKSGCPEYNRLKGREAAK